MKGLPFTNKLALYVLLLVTLNLGGGFVLAVLSIKYQYMGALACWTIVSTPIGTCATIVLGKIVNKSKAENTRGGIKYMKAEAETKEFIESPKI